MAFRGHFKVPRIHISGSFRGLFCWKDFWQYFVIKVWWLVCPMSNCKSIHHLLKPIGISRLSDEGFIDMTILARKKIFMSDPTNLTLRLGTIFMLNWFVFVRSIHWSGILFLMLIICCFSRNVKWKPFLSYVCNNTVSSSLLNQFLELYKSSIDAILCSLSLEKIFKALMFRV